MSDAHAPDWRNQFGETYEEVKAKIIPPRYDPARPCKKCGHTTDDKRFCTSRSPHWDPTVWEPRKVFLMPEDHIDRRCIVCGYEWLERTVDAPEMEPIDWMRARAATFTAWLERRREEREIRSQAAEQMRPRRRWWQP